MRIAHVVTYVSADGAFGGPVAVAAGQAEELARRGHDVDFIASWDGRAVIAIPGVNVRLFAARRVTPGLTGLFSSALLSFLRSFAGEYDAVHIHMGRDLVTLPAAMIALRRGSRVFLQTHGMVMPDSRPKARLTDFLLTRRALGGAKAIFALTDTEVTGVTHVAGRASTRVTQIPNGVAVREASAQEKSDPPVVLFLARLHPRKRVLAFAEAARVLIERGVTARFRVIGPDEGDLAALTDFKVKHQLERLEYGGSVPPGQGVEELARATVFVLPSRGEVFPMTVLEAMSVGAAVVITEDCGMSPELLRRRAALVTGLEPGDIATSIESLLNDVGLRHRQVEAAGVAIRDWLSIETVVDSVMNEYATAP